MKRSHRPPRVLMVPDSSRLAVPGLLLLLLVAHAAAEPVTLGLNSGARVEANVLQRNDDRIVLDLGPVVVTIPADAVAWEKSAFEDAGSAEAADATTSGSAAAIETLSPGQTVWQAGDDVDRLAEAVAIVSNPGGFGAGFVIDPNGRLLTNHHVVRGEKHNRVTLMLRGPDGTPEKTDFDKVTVEAYSMLLDCALLRIPEDQLEGRRLPALPLAPADAARAGMRVFAVGNPGVGRKMLEHSLSEGIVSSTNRNFNDVLYLQTTAAVNPGNSGGPLVDEQGRVVGLVTFRAIFQEGLAFALPVWYLRQFVDNAPAYAPRGDDKNTGYRYLDPSAPDAVPEDSPMPDSAPSSPETAEAP